MERKMCDVETPNKVCGNHYSKHILSGSDSKILAQFDSFYLIFLFP